MAQEKLFKVLNEDYIHPEDEELYFEDTDEYEYFEDTDEYECFEESQLCCETCDRDFYTTAQYEKHMSEHKICNIDGCKFNAHEKLIEKHVLMQHATGLYDKIRNINTPEDIAKWVEERKQRYPSKENILKRQEKQESMLKRGERIKKNENRFGKDKFRLTKTDTKKQFPKKKSKKPFVKEKKLVSLIDEKCDWNGNVYPFKGTSTLETDSEKEQSDFEDDEWSSNIHKSAPVKLNNALGALMGAYMSGGDTDEEEMKVDKVEVKVDTLELKVDKSELQVDKLDDSDGEPPIEVKIEKELPSPVIENEDKPIPNLRKRKRANRSHKPVHLKNRNMRNSRNKNFVKKNEFPYNFRKRKVTLLEKLLDNEIRQERNILLQCIRFTVENNFFSKST